jgi:hypothetical protein
MARGGGGGVSTAQEAGLGQMVPGVASGGISARASPADFGSNDAQQIEQLGRQGERAGGELAQIAGAQARQQAVIGAQAAAAAGEMYWDDQLRQRQEKAPPGAQGFTAQITKDHADWAKAQLDATADPLQKRLLQERFDTQAVGLHRQAAAFEQQELYSRTEADTKGALDTATSQVYSHPEKFGDQLRQLHEMVDQSAINPRAKGRLSVAITQTLGKALWTGQGERDPRGTLKALLADDAPGLDLGDRLALTNGLQSHVNQLDAEARTQARLAQAQAKMEAAQAQAENRAALSDRLQNEMALRADGQPVGKPISQAEVAAAYGPKRAAAAWATLQDHRTKADALGLVKGASIEDQDQLLADNHPDPAKPDYADQAAGYEAMRQAVSADRSRLLADPASDSLRTSAKAAQAWSAAAQDPAAVGPAISLSLAEQERRGVPEAQRTPLPKEVAASTVDAWKQATDGNARLGILSRYTTGLGDDALAGKALKQLEAAGLPQGAEYALDAHQQGDAQRAHEMMGELGLKPGEEPKLAPDQGKAVRLAVAGLYKEPNAAAAEAQAAALTMQPGALQQAGRGSQLVARLATRYAATEDADAAAKHAIRTVYGERPHTTDADLGIVPVPPGATDAKGFENALALTRENVDLSHLAPTREAVARMLPPGTPAGTIEGALAQATRDHAAWEGDVRAGARWLAAPGGYQLVLPTGQALPGPDGKARVWSADDIQHHAMTGGAPPGAVGAGVEFGPAEAGKPAGSVRAGNIDLHARPVVRNADGSISTVRSMSFEEDGKHILVPTVAADGSRILSAKDAIKQYHETGQHLGMFKSEAAATAYAKRLHEDQAREYAPNPFLDLLGNKPAEGDLGGAR